MVVTRSFVRLTGLLLGLSCLAGPARAEVEETASLRSKPALLRLSYEVLDVGPTETMGLAGVHYLVNVHPAWYVGASGFGALQGERGGFFTGGFTVGTGKRLGSRWLLDAGLFVGGGGGGAAPQGGGLMLRPHLGLSRSVGNSMMLGAGVSAVTFPNGDIDSQQLYLSLGIPFDVYYGRARDAGKTVHSSDLAGLRPHKTEWRATAGRYSPTADARTTADVAMTSTLTRVGFEYRKQSGSHGYLLIETGGAMGGQSDGFAELLAGVGYSVPLSRGLHLSASIAAGGAGGGQVDTGGGLVAKARAGLDYNLTSTVVAGLEAGHMISAGSFRADFYGVSLGYRIGEIGPGKGDVDWKGGGARLAKWRLAGTYQTTLDAARKTGAPRDMSLVGLKIEKFLTESVYLTGQAHGAFEGDAGGYAVGLIGAGWEIPLRKDGRLSFNAEFAAGAAGGGGVDVGGGAIVQPQVGLTWRLGQQLAARAEAGRVRGIEGRLDSNVIGVGLIYEFSRPEYRY